MKIAFIPSTFLPIIGGAEIQCHNMGNEIGKIHDVDIFLLDKINLKKINYKIKILPKLLINFVYLFKYYLKIDLTLLYRIYFSNLLKNKKYDIWHFHSLNYKTLLVITTLKKLNQKVAITFQGADIQIDRKINYGYRIKKKFNQLFLQVVPLVDIYYAISNNIVDELHCLKLDKSKIVKIPNSVDFQKVKKVKSKKSKKFTILTIGRYAEKKKGFDLVKKISKYLIGKIDFQWIIIGRGTNKLKEQNFFKNNSNYFKIIDEIKGNSEFIFPNSKLLKFYKFSHVYANLARIESFGITIIEAMASFMPIVSFFTKGGEELVINQKNGFLIKNGNFKDFSKKLIYISRKKISDSKIKIFNNNYLKKFDLKYVCSKTVKSYKDIISK